MHIIAKPWGYENIWAETSNYIGKLLYIKPGHKLSRQYHNTKEETFLVVSGLLTLEVGQGDDMLTIFLCIGESFHCPPGTIHRMVCDPLRNTVDLVVMEVSTPHLDDVVRLEDDYKRAV